MKSTSFLDSLENSDATFLAFKTEKPWQIISAPLTTCYISSSDFVRKEWCWRDSQPSVWAAAKLGRRRIRRKENLIWDPTKADKILLAISNGDRILLSVRDSISFNQLISILSWPMIRAWPLSNNSAFIWKFRLTATMIDFKKDASCTDCLNLMKAMHNMINWHFVLQNCTASCSLRDFM